MRNLTLRDRAPLCPGMDSLQTAMLESQTGILLTFEI